ncbi:hypothetical protein CAEBREN_05002 [Caenorhabditis brenneri]|uniref:Uncharacterized protein n=1 Tax=Caenorhabditis brenneri TaxID=135651 RepID=G0MD53_CAEBE|nr:hypothetical protein CAEBREN_05002 [Caenorhabditis brenneri]
MNPNQPFNWTGADGFAQGPLTRNPRQAPPPQQRIPDTRSAPQNPYRNVVRQDQPLQFYSPAAAHAGTGSAQVSRNNGIPRQTPPPQNRTHAARPMAQQATVMYAPLNGIGAQAYPGQYRNAQVRAETPQMVQHNVPGPSNGIRRPAPPPPYHQNPEPSGMAQSTQMAHEYRQSATPAGPFHQQATRSQPVTAQHEETYRQGPLMPTSRPVQLMPQPLLPQGPPQLPHHRQPQQQQQQQGQGVPRDNYMAQYFKNQKQHKADEARRQARELKKKEEAEKAAAESRRKREEEQQREQRRRAQFQAKYNSSDMNNMWIYGSDTNHQSTSGVQNLPVVPVDCFLVEDTEEVIGDGSEEHPGQPRGEEKKPGQMSELDQVKLFLSEQRGQDATELEKYDDADIMRTIMESSCENPETKEDIFKGLKKLEEEIEQKERAPASVNPSLPRRSATSVQPPSISPNTAQALSLGGTGPLLPNQGRKIKIFSFLSKKNQLSDYTSPQAPPSLASTSGQSGTNVTPPAHVTPPNPQVFPNMAPGQLYPQFPPAPMPPNLFSSQHHMQQGQHFIYPQNQEDHNVIVQRLQDRMMEYANQVRLKDVEIETLKNVVEMRDQEIERLRKELEAARATQNTSSSLPFHVPLAPSASGGSSTALKRGAVDNVAEIPEKICRVKEEPRDSERWVEETPEEAWRNHVQMMMKKEPEDVQHPVPQPAPFFPFPFQHAVVGQQPIQLLPNSAFSTSDVIVDNYFQRLAPQRIQTFDVALGVWTHRFSEPLLNRLVRQRPGQGFELWGLKIQNLNFAPFLFNPQSQSKRVPQLVSFWTFTKNYSIELRISDSSDFTRLNADEKGKWKAFKEVLTEFVTEQFQAGLIFRPGMKPE